MLIVEIQTSTNAIQKQELSWYPLHMIAKSIQGVKTCKVLFAMPNSEFFHK